MPSYRIFVRGSVSGIHRWPGASGQRYYLSDSHRHTFGFEVEAEVEHSDRQVEFHDLIHLARKALYGQAIEVLSDGLLDFDRKSCEDLAEGVFIELNLASIPVRKVTVNEDGEAGAIAYE